MAFTVVCNEKGYSKTGKIREFIREMVKAEIGEVELTAEEWTRIRAGIKEISEGRFASLVEVRREFARRKLAHNKGREQRKRYVRIARPTARFRP